MDSRGDVVIDANHVTTDWPLAVAIGVREKQDKIWVQTSAEDGRFVDLRGRGRAALIDEAATYLRNWATQIQ
jgi:hypothetical protein